MLRYLKMYTFLIKCFFKTKYQQKADFLIGIIGSLLVYLPHYIFISLISENSWQIAGFHSEILIFIQGIFIIVCSPLNIICDNMWNLKSNLIDGSYIKYYFKPGSSLFFFLAETINIRSFPEVFVGLYLIISNLKDINYSQQGLLFFLISIFFASFIPVSLRIISASVGFWITNSFGAIVLINNIVGYGKYPTILFGKYLGTVFTIVIPIIFIAYIPYLILITGNEIALLYLLFEILSSLLLLYIAMIIWRKGNTLYSATGT